MTLIFATSSLSQGCSNKHTKIIDHDIIVILMHLYYKLSTFCHIMVQKKFTRINIVRNYLCIIKNNSAAYEHFTRCKTVADLKIANLDVTNIRAEASYIP